MMATKPMSRGIFVVVDLTWFTDTKSRGVVYAEDPSMGGYMVLYCFQHPSKSYGMDAAGAMDHLGLCRNCQMGLVCLVPGTSCHCTFRRASSRVMALLQGWVEACHG